MSENHGPSAGCDALLAFIHEYPETPSVGDPAHEGGWFDGYEAAQNRVADILLRAGYSVTPPAVPEGGE